MPEDVLEIHWEGRARSISIAESRFIDSGGKKRMIRTIPFDEQFYDYTPIWTPLFVMAAARGLGEKFIPQYGAEKTRFAPPFVELDAIAEEIGIQLTADEQAALDASGCVDLWGSGSSESPWGTTVED